MRKSIKFFMIIAIVLSITTGCLEKGAEDSEDEVIDDEAEYNIGVSVYYMSEFITLAVDGLESEAEKSDVNINILDANNDVAEQISQMENLISQGVDAIIVAAVDADALDGVIKQARDNDVEVIGLNMIINSDHLSAYVGPNDVEAGELEMKHAAEEMDGKGNIVVFEGPIGISAQIQRAEGIDNILEEYPDINVLEKQTANWSRSEALSIMENWIESHGSDIDGVVAQNDEMALGAIQALEAAGLDDDTVVVGVDAIEDGVNSIKDDKLSASVFQDADVEGGLAVEKAVEILDGAEEFEDHVEIEMELVTKENYEKYLEVYEE